MFNPLLTVLTEGVALANGSIVAQLDTPEALEAFWLSHKARYPYSARGIAQFGMSLLRVNQWVFGTTPQAVIETVFRWPEQGIVCEWQADDGADAQQGAWVLPTAPLGWEDALGNPHLAFYDLDDPALGAEAATRQLQLNLFELMEIDTSCSMCTYRKNAVRAAIREWKFERHDEHDNDCSDLAC